MGIGGSIFLIAVGAIVAFGIRDQNVGPFDLNVIGWVLMLAGLAGLLTTMWIWNTRRRRVVAVSPGQRVERERIVEAPPREVVDEEGWAQSRSERPRY
jgi:hypothetical protein